MATKKNEKEMITINPIKISQSTITIVGDSPLLVHAWSEKAKKQMLAEQQKENGKKLPRVKRDPFADFMNALYWITPKPKEDTPAAFEKAVDEGAKFGFPLIAIKQAVTAACYRAGIIPNQVGMKTSFYDGGNAGSGLELAVIETEKPPYCREDMVKVGGINKTADLRYRPCFENWKIRLQINLVENGNFSMESVVNGLNLAGFMNGIGEWRVERDGDFGRFHVEMEG